MPLRYKFVELTKVTAAALEVEVNRWVQQGWQLDAIRFVTGEAAKRPGLAFVSFVRDDEEERLDVPAVSSIRRRPKIVELGELDLGDVEPFEADLDWANARSRASFDSAAARPRSGRTDPIAGRRGASRNDSPSSRSDTLPPPKAALRRGRAAPGAGRRRASRSDQK